MSESLDACRFDPDLLDPWQPYFVNACCLFFFVFFFSLFLALHIECKDKRHYGNVIDGGWDACVSEPFRPAVNDCLVYSFGLVTSVSINRDEIQRMWLYLL